MSESSKRHSKFFSLIFILKCLSKASIQENNNKMELGNTGMSTGNLADSNYIRTSWKEISKTGERKFFNTGFQYLKDILKLRETGLSIQYIMCRFCLFFIHSSQF